MIGYISLTRGARLKAASIALGLITVVGCGESRVEVHPVTGKLTYDGKPAAGAQIVLHPVGTSLPAELSAVGKVKDDGVFEIGAYEQNDGVPVGDYVATVQWFKLTQNEGGSGRGPNVLPDKYSKPDTSPIKISVKTGRNELKPIELTR